MIDRDLAQLYGVEARALNQAVQPNRDRFAADFMFQLTLKEGKTVMRLRSQTVILKRDEHLKHAPLPYVFTEHGAAMLASVLKSERAVRASIVVVEAFVSLRRMLASSGSGNRMSSVRPERPERRIGFDAPEHNEKCKS